MKKSVIRIIIILIIFQNSITGKSQMISIIPIEFAKLVGNECIVAKGIELNGKKLNLVFDTGAEGSGLNEQTIKELNLVSDTNIFAKGAGGLLKLSLYKNRKVSIDNIDYQLDFLTFPLLPAILQDGTLTNGILGLGSFKDRYVEMNFDEMVLKISDNPINTENDQISILRTESDGGVRSIIGSILTNDDQTIKGKMYFDTGNPVSLILDQNSISEYNFLSEKENMEKIQLGGLGNNLINSYISSIPELKIGDFSIKHIPVIIKDTSSVNHRNDIANIGLSIIKKFNIIFNNNQKEMIIYKSKYFDTPLSSETKTVTDKTSTEEIIRLVIDGNYEKFKEEWDNNPNLSKISILSKNGNTLLHIAILSGNDHIAEFLIKEKIEINTKNSANGATPLHLAVYKKNIKILKLLLENRADKTITDATGKTPLQMAEILKVEEAVELLK